MVQDQPIVIIIITPETLILDPVLSTAELTVCQQGQDMVCPQLFVTPKPHSQSVAEHVCCIPKQVATTLEGVVDGLEDG